MYAQGHDSRLGGRQEIREKRVSAGGAGATKPAGGHKLDASRKIFDTICYKFCCLDS
jgi:hypothetical protein